ncbi:MAG: VWA domain-containing protein [Clostridia bacterium]|nr:VWA domain-containing protein [Clostridia bacterium]
MKLLFPLGLLALLLIPVIIVIYVIKNKYTEQTVSSTYIWSLSEKFLKHRNPISEITGIISLILQILAVLLVTIVITRPVFAIRGGADDYCFIFDGSGSMNIVQKDKTRFDIGKEKIADIINDSVDGCTYSLIFVGDTTSVVYQEITDKQQAVSLLNDRCQPSYGAVGFTYAAGVAQEYFNANPSVTTYLITDKSYNESENVTIIDVSAHEENYAVSGVTAVYKDRVLEVGGDVISYENSADLQIKVYVNGEDEAKDSTALHVEKLIARHFEFEISLQEYESVTVEIVNHDSLMLDNTITLFNDKTENRYDILVVSDTPTFIRNALMSQTGAKVDVVEPDKYINVTKSYNLYVFDSFSPRVLPSDGAVWFFNPTSTNDIPEANFTYQNEIEIDGDGLLEYSTESNTIVRQLLQGLEKRDAYIIRYVKCGVPKSFKTIASYEGTPLIFTGTNKYERKETVFAFSLNDSTLPVTHDFMRIITNLYAYTFPKLCESSEYFVGDTMIVNMGSGYEDVKVISPHGNSYSLDTDAPYAEHNIEEVGVYTIMVKNGDGVREYHVFVSLPEEERFTTLTDASFSLAGEASTQKRDGVYNDLWKWLALIAALVVAADWIIYCYEQYQLR